MVLDMFLGGKRLNQSSSWFRFSLEYKTVVPQDIITDLSFITFIHFNINIIISSSPMNDCIMITTWINEVNVKKKKNHFWDRVVHEKEMHHDNLKCTNLILFFLCHELKIQRRLHFKLTLQSCISESIHVLYMVLLSMNDLWSDKWSSRYPRLARWCKSSF